MIKVFINGSAGTTGLRLKQRLSERGDIQLLEISDALRKNPAAVKEKMAQADFTFLCLPDDAAKEAAELAADLQTRIIDTSTAHRCDSAWVYGFPELSPEHRQSIQNARLVASPGCHASGFISLIYPLIAAGALGKDALLSCTSLTGFSGGGKKMIAEYQDAARSGELESTKEYAMAQAHKHLPEMLSQCKLEAPPVFMPIVGDFYSGMLVSVPLHSKQLNGKHTPEEIRGLYKKHYAGSRLIKVSDEAASALYTNSLSGSDGMEIFVSGNDERILLSSRFDNLGKGASGAAIQCFNIMCGMPEDSGLTVI